MKFALRKSRNERKNCGVFEDPDRRFSGESGDEFPQFSEGRRFLANFMQR
jgi:hypothetical protein